MIFLIVKVSVLEHKPINLLNRPKESVHQSIWIPRIDGIEPSNEDFAHNISDDVTGGNDSAVYSMVCRLLSTKTCHIMATSS